MKTLRILIGSGVAAGLGLVSGLFFILSTASPITFESLESKTETGSPVFNQVQFQGGWNQDVWLMKQSHHGHELPLANWDRLAIVVDKTVKPYRASFYQFTPAQKLEFGGPSESAPYKAMCFACHANGPRAVRPQFHSESVAVSLPDRIRIALWDLRVKTYGRVDSVPGAEIPGGAPFKSRHAILSLPLGLKTCTHCHSPNGFRSELKLEHLSTARFLVNQGIMPPFPFKATPSEIKKLNHL